MLNQRYFHPMNFNLEDYDIRDLGLGDYSLGDLGLGDFNLGDFDLTPFKHTVEYTDLDRKTWLCLPTDSKCCQFMLSSFVSMVC